MGKVIMSGIVPQLVALVTGIPASELAVGSTVKLMENGSAVEYLVVNQGIPSGSSLYDSSCDGTWLLRKDVYQTGSWQNGTYAQYEVSVVHSFLNGDFLSLFDSVTQETMKQVKIPYCTRVFNSYYGTVQYPLYTGVNGLSTKVFLLAGFEVGFTSTSYFHEDGAKLDYFDSTSAKRIAYLDGTATSWWLRSPYAADGGNATYVYTDGSQNCGSRYESFGYRPALILPSNALFDEETLILKGA